MRYSLTQVPLTVSPFRPFLLPQPRVFSCNQLLLPIIRITWRQYLSRSQRVAHTSRRHGGVTLYPARPWRRAWSFSTSPVMSYYCGLWVALKKPSPLQSSKSSLFSKTPGGGGGSHSQLFGISNIQPLFPERLRVRVRRGSILPLLTAIAPLLP